MRTTGSTPRPNSTVWHAALVVAWLAGALVGQVPFQFHYKLGNGHFGYNILLTVAVSLAGIILLVGLLRLARHRARTPGWQRVLPVATIALLDLTTICSVLPFFLPSPALIHRIGLGVMGAWLLLVVAALACTWRSPLAIENRRAAELNRRPSETSFNGAFWLLVFALLLATDLWGLGQIEGRTTGETVLLLAGRVFSLGGATLGVLLLLHALRCLFPTGLRWLITLCAALLPAGIVADFAAGLYWQQSFLDIINSFTLAGHFDVTQLLEAAGIEQTPRQLFFGFLALLAVSAGVYAFLQWASRYLPTHLGIRGACALLAVCWLGSVVQEGLCRAWMRREIWQAEHTTFKVHLGPFSPDPGYETIPVEFSPTLLPSEAEELLAGPLPELERRPDIFVVMVETWRADSIDPEVAPFLHRFREESCQQFDLTFAGSNCTPVSWYTFFHSQLGIHWKEAVSLREEAGELPGAYPLRLLRRLGYQLNVHAVCDLGYQEMSDLNFGSDHRLLRTYHDQFDLPRGLSIPEREIIAVDALKEEILSTPSGGNFHLLSLDSPHYNYYWPAGDFQPIHADCAGSINYGSLKPSSEEVREVLKRYENSVHWIDQQLEDFIGFLKDQGRYDNSIIVFTGDHGEEFQEHGSWFHCSNLKRPQTEVPIMIKWPAWMTPPPGQPQASHLDVMPSILDALGLDEAYFGQLAGHSLLREHPGESVISTLWAGVSGVGVCFIKDGVKANFAASRLWTGNVPRELYLASYSNRDDELLDPIETRGDLSHLAFLRQAFPVSTRRFFSKFGEESQESSAGRD